MKLELESMSRDRAVFVSLEHNVLSLFLVSLALKCNFNV